MNSNSSNQKGKKIVRKNPNQNEKRKVEEKRKEVPKKKVRPLPRPYMENYEQEKEGKTRLVKPTEYPKEGKKNIPKKKKRKNRKRVVFLFSCFFVLGLAIALFYLMFHLTTFDVKEILVTGNEKYLKQEIISQSGIKLNENVFSQYFTKKDMTLDALPYIKNVVLKISFPDTMEIEVEERKTVYLAFDKEKNKYFRMDQEGYILEEIPLSSKEEGELLVDGITFNNQVILGEKINEIDYDKLLVYEKIAQEYANTKINANITKVNFENSLTTITLNDKLNVILPNDTDLSYKLDLLKDILKKFSADMQGVIDMTKTDPVYSIY